MAVNLLERMLRSCRPRVFPLVGNGGRAAARRLRLDDELIVSDSPRDATLLLVVGDLPPPLARAARLPHDQTPPPRGVVVWSDDPGTRAAFPGSAVVQGHSSPCPAIESAFRGLMDETRPSSPALLPADHPVPWRGIGEFGQGGEGMMGGRPYGRAMAMPGEEIRDGLILDRNSLTLGPFLSWMPPGAELDIELQGDVLQSLIPKAPAGALASDLPEIFARAQHEEVSICDLEVARARHYLGATADLLLLHGLDALAARVIRLAERASAGDEARVRALSRALSRSGALRLATRGVGTLTGEALAHTGPAARAAGRTEDARTQDPAYEGLGFELITRARGDAEARGHQRLDEAAFALELAGRAAARTRSPGPPLEGPRGPLGDDNAAQWGKLLEVAAPLQSLDAFVTTLVSLDLDPADVPAHAGYGSSLAAARAGRA